MKILIVDDHPDIRQLLVDGVSHAGYEVVTACDGEDAWEKVTQDNPDVILLDLMMPKIDGFTFLQNLRQSPPVDKWIPVIIVSALDELKDMRRGFDLEADHYITKPWKIADILKGIDMMINLIPQRK